MKYVLNLFDNPKSGAGSHVDESGTTQVFFFAAVRAEFDALLADDCTGEAPWPSVPLAFTLVPDMFSVFLSSWLLLKINLDLLLVLLNEGMSQSRQ